MGRIDFLSESQYCLRSELARSYLPVVDYYSARRFQYLEHALPGSFDYEDLQSWAVEGMEGIFLVVPQGMFETTKANYTRKLLGVVKMIDPASRRVFPERESPVSKQDDDENLWNLLSFSVGPPLSNSIKQFAYAQVQVDESPHRVPVGAVPPRTRRLSADAQRFGSRLRRGSSARHHERPALPLQAQRGSNVHSLFSGLGPEGRSRRRGKIPQYD